MLTTALLSKLAAAFGLSLAALAGYIVVQGHFLFPDELARALTPDQVVVRQFSLGNQNRAALAVFMIPRSVRPEKSPLIVAGIYDLTAGSPTFRQIESRSSPWRCAVMSRRGDAFLGTDKGGLYWLDMASPASSLVHFGTHPTRYPYQMVCPDDGSLVVVNGERTTAWNPQTAKMIWEWEGPFMRSCAFVPRSQRLICGLETGEIVEINPLTGNRLQLIARQSNPTIALAFSPDGERLAALDSVGKCTVSELTSGAEIWSRTFLRTATTPQFSTDGRSLLLGSAEPGAEISVVSSLSGLSQRKLAAPGVMIKGLRVLENGTAYAWSIEGTITRLKLSTAVTMQCLAPALPRNGVFSTDHLFTPSASNISDRRVESSP